MGLKSYALEIKSDEFHSVFRLIPRKEILVKRISYSCKKGRLEQETSGIKGKFKEEYIDNYNYSKHNIYLDLGRTKIEINEIDFDNGAGESSGTMKTKNGFLKWNKTLLNNLSVEYIF